MLTSTATFTQTPTQSASCSTHAGTATNPCPLSSTTPCAQADTKNPSVGRSHSSVSPDVGWAGPVQPVRARVAPGRGRRARPPALTPLHYTTTPALTAVEEVGGRGRKAPRAPSSREMQGSLFFFGGREKEEEDETSGQEGVHLQRWGGGREDTWAGRTTSV